METKKIIYQDHSQYVTDQLPLDAKMFFRDVQEMVDLGPNNEKAYLYYPGMIAIDASTGTIYVWRQWDQANETGLLADGFTYPEGYEKHGVSYSGRLFNFIPISMTGGEITINVNDDLVTNEVHSITDPVTSVTVNNPGSAGFDNLTVYLNGVMQAPDIDYTVSGTTVTFSEILQSGDIVTLNYRRLTL